MAGTRSSARLASNGAAKTQSASPEQNKAAGKRKAEDAASPPRKRGKAAATKPTETKQMGIEQAIDNQAEFEVKDDQTSAGADTVGEATNGHAEEDQHEKGEDKADVVMEDATADQAKSTVDDATPADKDINDAADKPDAAATEPAEDKEETAAPAQSATAKAGDAAKTNDNPADAKPQEKEAVPETNGSAAPKDDKPLESAAEGEAITTSKERADAVPAEVLEKGLIYFFIRGRVQTDDPHSVVDIQRTHIVLRPLPKGASLSEGSLPNDPTCRLIALPKKTLPKGPSDKFMVFSEKGKASLEDLKSFVSAEDYKTASDIPRHTPAAKPVAEGIYTITAVNRTNHLAYMLTLPEKLTKLHEDLGLASEGAFALSTKNPDFPGPANASLGTPPKFEQAVLSEFNGLRWMPTKPIHMDYDNAQFLLIGTQGDTVDHATNGADGAKEEMEKLEGEDEIRVESLKGNEAIFDDLQTSHKTMPKLTSTW